MVAFENIFKKFIAVHAGWFLKMLLFSVSTTSALSASAQNVEQDWPCIQAYVPQVAAAVVWPEPIDEAIEGTWRESDLLKTTVENFGNLESFSNADKEQLQNFADSIPDGQKIDNFNRVADGIVEKFNQRRRDYLKGIRKFTRQQIAVAKQIETNLNELSQLAGKTDQASVTRKLEIEETTAWQQRIFDRRESAIRLLCETPVELETLMGDILRELAQNLP